ncbi:MAG: HPP family protein [Candidatus Acetothermia bacterium]
MLVKEFLTKDPAKTKEGSRVCDTRELMEDKNFRIIFVVDGEERLSGFLTYDSIKDKPGEREIDDFVSRSTLHTQVDDPIDKAVSIIREYGLMVLPVVDGERKLVGVLTPGKLFEEFSELLNFGEGGFWLTLEYEDSESFDRLLSVMGEHDVEILSLLNSPDEERNRMILKIGKVDDSEELKRSLEKVMTDE